MSAKSKIDLSRYGLEKFSCMACGETFWAIRAEVEESAGHLCIGKRGETHHERLARLAEAGQSRKAQEKA
ncbi:MAG: hypothetical protein L0387_24885 [Acidobacteria bacterium]|nr:hypothetical protein [Acidobacteriota bacterium]